MSEHEADTPLVNKSVEQKPITNTPGAIILQWLSYAFWGWLAVGLIWLIAVILINAIVGTAVNEVVPYAVAASVVLLPIALLTDLFYRKHEPVKKLGAAMIVMVIHAVLFALLAIGALVITVFTAVNLSVNVPTSPNGQVVAVLTALFATLLYALIFLRILNPLKSRKPSLIFSLLMLVLTVLLLVFAIVGPIMKSINTRQDRLIEQNLTSVQSEIREYIQDQKNLPKSLNDVTFTGGAKELIDKKLVEYIPDTASQRNYKLCVTYIAPKGEEGSYQTTRNYISTYSHPAGRVCYTLESNIPSNLFKNSSRFDSLDTYQD